MSGYRSLHRQAANDHGAPIWQVQTMTYKNGWMIWTASGNGIVNGFRVHEKDNTDDSLDAAALKLISSFELVANNTIPTSNNKAALGCTQVSVIRNYVGDDDLAGDVIVASIDLVGRVRVWSISEEDINQTTTESLKKKPVVEFHLESATGTSMALCSPKNNGSNTRYNQNILMAVGCLDGSVVVVASGLGTPALEKANKKPLEAGTIVETLGSDKNAVATRLVWHSAFAQLLAVGRQDGTIDLYREGKRWHKFARHSSPVRGIAFTPDGQLLIAGSDRGMVCIWDLNRKNLTSPPLIHHVTRAHEGWILDLIPCEDSRRFVTSGTDGRIHVWTLSGQGSYAPLFKFSAQDDDSPGHNTPWTIHANYDHNRLVAGTEKGWLQVFSMEK